MSVASFPPPSMRQMLEEAERELAMRREVYPRQVAAKKMSQRTADYRIHLQAAIVEKFRTAIEKREQGQ